MTHRTSAARTAQGVQHDARELFFSEGKTPDISDWVLRSWERSRHLPRHFSSPEPVNFHQLDERREQSIRLLACAQPELDGLAEHVSGQDCIVILSDATGLILQEIGSANFLAKAERVALMPGVDWSEGGRGTNAIGTALAERHAVMVLGTEHYLMQNAGLGCAAAPILDGRGAIIGVLDITGEPGRINEHALALVRLAAQQVEHRLLVSCAEGHLLRFHVRPGLIGTPREGLMVITDGRIVAANRYAVDVFGSSWAGVLDRDVESVLGHRWGRLEHQRGMLTRPGGRQIAAVVDRLAPSTYRAVMVGEREDTPDAVAPLVEKARRVLDQGVPVLVTGETGSGKNRFARRLHAASRRRAGPFVTLDCASLPEALIESELFGHAEGAGSGARKRGTPGRIREADGGVLFLDSIGEMPLALQSRLLRVLEDRTVVPLGGGPPVSVDFDLVCATDRNLGELVESGRFRADLLYRLAGFTIGVPALRERADRRQLILQLFDELGAAQRGLRLASEALDCLAAWSWPGNVCEACSVLKSLIALAEDDAEVGVCDLPPAIQGARGSLAGEAAPQSVPDQDESVASLRDTTRHAIAQALQACGNDVTKAARLLGVHRSTVYRYLARERRRA